MPPISSRANYVFVLDLVYVLDQVVLDLMSLQEANRACDLDIEATFKAVTASSNLWMYEAGVCLVETSTHLPGNPCACGLKFKPKAPSSSLSGLCPDASTQTVDVQSRAAPR